MLESAMATAPPARLRSNLPATIARHKLGARLKKARINVEWLDGAWRRHRAVALWTARPQPQEALTRPAGPFGRRSGPDLFRRFRSIAAAPRFSGVARKFPRKRDLRCRRRRKTTRACAPDSPLPPARRAPDWRSVPAASPR